MRKAEEIILKLMVSITVPLGVVTLFNLTGLRAVTNTDYYSAMIIGIIYWCYYTLCKKEKKKLTKNSETE